MLFLGIDIGTSGCKVALMDELGDIKYSASASYQSYYPQPGYVEQNPNEWWDAICVCLKKLWEMGAKPSSIAAIGADGISWAAIPIDSEGEVLANTPLWMDTRAMSICDAWEQKLGADNIFKVSGNPFSPTYTLPKVLFLMQHQPELIKKTEHILQCNSFVVYKLTGKITMEYSQSYGWQNFSQSELKYDEALTKEFGLPERFLIEPVDSHKIVGEVTSEVEKQCGLIKGTPVIAGGLDAACSTLGVGVIDSGQTQEQGGQAGGMSVCVESAIAHPKLILSPHVVKGKWLLQGGSVGGGASLKWFAEHVALKSNGRATGSDFEKLNREAESSIVGSNGLIFLPYLLGERSPIWDNKAQGMYFGLKYSTKYSDLIRATMEGVSYSLKHNIEIAKEAGAAITKMYGTGGSANSKIWTQIKSDVTGLPMIIPASDEATTTGVSILAMIGAGVYKNCQEAVEKIVKVKRSHQPDLKNTETYQRYFEIYKKLYKDTSKTMSELFDI